MHGSDSLLPGADRTELAEDRTLLAHERSYASWIRTGLTCIGIGLGFSALFSSMEPVWVPKTIASMLLVIAIYIFVSAARRAGVIRSRLDAHNIAALKTIRVWMLAWAFVALTLALIISVWILV